MGPLVWVYNLLAQQIMYAVIAIFLAGTVAGTYKITKQHRSKLDATVAQVKAEKDSVFVLFD